MILEALLAYAHFAAILTVVVFMTSEAALCRPQWLNAEVVHRLGRVDAIYWGALAAVLLTGVARMAWGIKGLSWYAAQPLLQLKIALFIAIALISVKPTLSFARWRRTLAATGHLPEAAELNAARRWVMIESHLLVLLPLAAVFVARGVGTP
jgi:putative membrane protein